MAVPPNLLPIGLFASLTRLTVKALRHYGELGLLEPAWVDPESGYRYYSPGQLEEAERIATLRGLEVPLDDIAAVLDRRPGSDAVLAAHRARLAERVERLRAVIDDLDRQRTARPGADVVLRELAPCRCAGLRRDVALAELAAEVPRMFSELYGFLHRFQLRAVGPSYSVFHVLDEHGAYREELADAVPVEIGLPVVDPVPRGSAVEERTLEGGDALVAIHRGHYSQTLSVHGAIAAEAARRGLALAAPPREHYLAAPLDALTEWRIEIVWPVKAQNSPKSPAGGA